MLLKEAMHNTLKHAASARHLDLSVKASPAFLAIEWKDDGPGFDQQSTRTGNGLDNMQARAKKMNAQLLIDSTKGSHITLRLPLK